jgi:hypothetical protein
LKLAEAMNTYEIALFMIKNKGYKIGIELENDEITTYKAFKDKKEIYGFNPLSLLALVNIVEEYGDNWKKVDTDNLYNKVVALENETDYI